MNYNYIHNLRFTLVICVCILLFNNVFGQDLIKNKAVNYKEGFINPSSSVIMHLTKVAVTYSGMEISSTIDYQDSAICLYTVNEQADMMYFEEYFDKTKQRIKIQGYFKLMYIDSEIGYMWVKYLVWNYYNTEGMLVKKQFYKENKKTDAIAMPQPKTTIQN